MQPTTINTLEKASQQTTKKKYTKNTIKYDAKFNHRRRIDQERPFDALFDIFFYFTAMHPALSINPKDDPINESEPLAHGSNCIDLSPCVDLKINGQTNTNNR